MSFDFAIPRAARDDAGHKIKPCPRRTVGNRNRRIIATEVVMEEVYTGHGFQTKIIPREYAYHATKGWRRVRLPA